MHRMNTNIKNKTERINAWFTTQAGGAAIFACVAVAIGGIFVLMGTVIDPAKPLTTPAQIREAKQDARRICLPYVAHITVSYEKDGAHLNTTCG